MKYVFQNGHCMIVGRDGTLKPVSCEVDPAELPQKGEPGRDGPAGADGISGDSIVPAGKWKRGKSYAALSLVFHRRASWLARVETSKEPSLRSPDWQLVARSIRGRDGEILSTTRVINKTIGGSGERESFPLSFPALQGQVVTTSGLANAITAPNAIGMCHGPNIYCTEGSVTFPGNLIPGETYWLDIVDGAITNVAPTVGHVVVIGMAVDANTLDLEIGQPIKY